MKQRASTSSTTITETILCYSLHYTCVFMLATGINHCSKKNECHWNCMRKTCAVAAKPDLVWMQPYKERIRISMLKPGCYSCRWLVNLQGRAARPPCLVPEEAHCPPATDYWWWLQRCCHSAPPLDLPIWQKLRRTSEQQIQCPWLQSAHNCNI